MFAKRLRFERSSGEIVRARVAAAAIVAGVLVLLGPEQFQYTGGGYFGANRAGHYVALVLRTIPFVSVAVWLARTRRVNTVRFVRQARAIAGLMLVLGVVLVEFVPGRDLFWPGGAPDSGYNDFLGWILFIGGSAILVSAAGQMSRMPSWSATLTVFLLLVVVGSRLRAGPSTSANLETVIVDGWSLAAACGAAWLLPYPFLGAATRGAALEQDRLAEWLHSELLGDLAALRRKFSVEEPDQGAVLGALGDLDSRVREHRLESRLHSEGNVPLAEVVAYQMRRFRDYVEYSSVPMLGTTQVEPRTAQSVHRVLGDLLANAVAAGARTIGIEVDQKKRDLVVAVIDDGPGISVDRSRSGGGLQLLEQSLHEDGGSLAIEAGSNGSGTRVTVTFPTNGHRTKSPDQLTDPV